MIFVVFILALMLAVGSHIFAVKNAKADMESFNIVSDSNAAVRLGISFKH